MTSPDNPETRIVSKPNKTVLTRICESDDEIVSRGVNRNFEDRSARCCLSSHELGENQLLQGAFAADLHLDEYGSASRTPSTNLAKRVILCEC